MREHFLWSEKYRPKTVEECVLPANLKNTFQKFVDQKNIPNLLLSGSQGTGKTTVARAMLEQLECDYVIINASLDGGIDKIRTDIANFASSVSFTGGRKYVILDEADYLTHAAQPALRNFMDTFSKNCGFIFTANYRNKIIEPLWSRCACIDFVFDKEDRPKLASEFYTRVTKILVEENIDFQKKPLVAVITEYFPDYRRMLNELQRYSVNGIIDEGILSDLTSTSITTLVGHMKKKDFTSVRRWATENLNNDQGILFKSFYNEASELFAPSYIPSLVLTLAKYQYQAAFALDAEINFSAAMAEVMVEASWK